MVTKGPSSYFEKTLIANTIKTQYPMDSGEVIHSSAEVIKEVLLSHIAQINPKLAEEMMKSPTEENVLKILKRVNSVAIVAKDNNSKSTSPLVDGNYWNKPTSNDDSYNLAA